MFVTHTVSCCAIQLVQSGSLLPIHAGHCCRGTGSSFQLRLCVCVSVCYRRNHAPYGPAGRDCPNFGEPVHQCVWSSQLLTHLSLNSTCMCNFGDTSQTKTDQKVQCKGKV